MEKNKLLMEYTKFQVDPVKKVDGGDSPYECFERCAADDPELAYWSVYGRKGEAEWECLADCSKKETAEYVKGALENQRKMLQVLLDQFDALMLWYQDVAAIPVDIRQGFEISMDKIETVVKEITGQVPALFSCHRGDKASHT